MPGETLLVNLSQLEQWQGTASLIAIAATGDAGQTLALEMAALKRSSLSNILASTWQDWTYYNGLNQSATNAHTGVARGSLAWSATPYVALVLLPLLLGLVFVQWRSPGPKAWHYLFAGIFLGWLALDTLWLDEAFVRIVESENLAERPQLAGDAAEAPADVITQ